MQEATEKPVASYYPSSRQKAMPATQSTTYRRLQRWQYPQMPLAVQSSAIQQRILPRDGVQRGQYTLLERTSNALLIARLHQRVIPPVPLQVVARQDQQLLPQVAARVVAQILPRLIVVWHSLCLLSG